MGHFSYLALLVLFLSFRDILSQRSAARLMNDLLRSYDPRIAAVQPVELLYGISPVAVVDVDPRRDLLTVDLWLKHSWVDRRLQWDSEAYRGNDVLFLKKKDVFIPEMALYNGKLSPINDPEVVVYPNGLIIYFPATRAEVYCDLPPLPFQGEVCSIKLGPWTHDTRQTKILTFDPEVDTSFMRPSGGICQIDRAWATVEETSYPCCPGIAFGTTTLLLNLTCGGDEPDEEVAANGPVEGHHEARTSRKGAADVPAPNKKPDIVSDEEPSEESGFQPESLPLFLAPFFVLLVFLLPPKPVGRATFGSLVFACLLLVWTSDRPLGPHESNFVLISAVVTIVSTFVSLVTCVMRSSDLKDNKADLYEPKPPGCTSRIARLIDVTMVAAVAVVLGVTAAGLFMG